MGDPGWLHRHTDAGRLVAARYGPPPLVNCSDGSRPRRLPVVVASGLPRVLVMGTARQALAVGPAGFRRRSPAQTGPARPRRHGWTPKIRRQCRPPPRRWRRRLQCQLKAAGTVGRLPLEQAPQEEAASCCHDQNAMAAPMSAHVRKTVGAEALMAAKRRGTERPRRRVAPGTPTRKRSSRHLLSCLVCVGQGIAWLVSPPWLDQWHRCGHRPPRSPQIH
mmetsp:Transcript_84712/g.236420  ORF Transcript_84712/g.236420 Transcript_84712/m.236420 type:complete len:220 (-) Transcript_84712:318-977(-)